MSFSFCSSPHFALLPIDILIYLYNLDYVATLVSGFFFLLHHRSPLSFDFDPIFVSCYANFLSGFNVYFHAAFYGDSDNQIFEHVRTGRFDFPSPDWDGISAAAKNFICSLLRKDPSSRLTAAEALKHPWILEQLGPSVSAADRDRMRRKSAIAMDADRCVTFQKFVGMQKLKKAALGYIATHLNPSEVGELEGMFQKIDADHDGVFSLREMDEALAEECFPDHLQSELRKLRDDLRLTGEDSVNWRDFSAAMMDKKYAMRDDKIREAFDHFRRSGDGQTLLVSDLIEIFGGEEEMKEIIDHEHLDDNHDGEIRFEDFKRMITG